MIEQIKHLLNLEEQRYIIMGGLQGAGKSTIVSMFENVGFEVVCPDRIRFELASREKANEGKYESEIEDLHKNEMLVWRLAEQRVKKHLENGKSVIFDATNLTMKARKQPINWAGAVKPIAVYVECPLAISQERNLKRASTEVGYRDGKPVYGRYVPSYVIELRWKSQFLPLEREGFKEVIIIHVNLEEKNFNPDYVNMRLQEFFKSEDLYATLKIYHDNGELKDLLPSFDIAWEVDQENKNHDLTMSMHMIRAAERLREEGFEMFLAGLLHDVGKPITKMKHGKIKIATDVFAEGEKVEIKAVLDEGFVVVRKLDNFGEKEQLVTVKHVEIDNNAHYYEHDLIGAVAARRDLVRLGLPKETINKVYEYIALHMSIPFNKVSEASLRKLVDKIGEDNALKMLKMRKADKLAGSAHDYIDNVHEEHVRIIHEIIEYRNKYKKED